VLILRAKTFEELQFHSLKVPAVRLTYSAENQITHADVECTQAWLAATAFCDLVIVAATTFYVYKQRTPTFSRTTLAALSRILKVSIPYTLK
jgi:hypothetical protein